MNTVDDPHLPRRSFLQQIALGAVAVAAGIRASAAETALPPRPKKQLRGLFPIGQSPFTASDELDLEALAAQVAFCNRGGVHGFVWPQIASHWTTLKPDERLRGAEAILAAGRGGATSLVIGVQSKTGDMAEVEHYAGHAADHGADAIVALPPPGVMDEKKLLAYYQQIGRMTALPLFVQSQGSMSVDLMVEIFHTVPTARHLKDEAAAGGGPLHRITEIRRRTNDEMKVFSGQGVRTMIAEMELGFSGHCPYVALAEVYAAAFDLWHSGREREAFDMFGRILAFNSLGTADPNAILVARGVFKPGVRSRTEPTTGASKGGGGPNAANALHLDEPAIRAALDHYLKPYLRA